ncbi:hypothetical protein GCM10010168_39450 [Actinoplanes ianthinogenes]|uniref:Uncharacterized protein n=1 Tax=Actinoplanes ianthinogenes TaxID=122358 RepID=A0ABM7LWN4_9ACTN|nr:hypothetical protein Aiant_44030 [Actinoplanes ianthinogenes]GGR17900.1 hypothetical protein GCM10010168_39450 [Actinoplanes ianthinogenes]
MDGGAAGPAACADRTGADAGGGRDPRTATGPRTAGGGSDGDRQLKKERDRPLGTSLRYA